MVAPSLVIVTSPDGDVIILSMPRGPRDVRSVSAIARPATMLDSRMFCSVDVSFFMSPVEPPAFCAAGAADACDAVLLMCVCASERFLFCLCSDNQPVGASGFCFPRFTAPDKLKILIEFPMHFLMFYDPHKITKRLKCYGTEMKKNRVMS